MSLVWLAVFLTCSSSVFILLLEHNILLLATAGIIERSKRNEYLVDGLLKYSFAWLKSSEFVLPMPVYSEVLNRVAMPILSKGWTARLEYRYLDVSDGSAYDLIKIKVHIFNDQQVLKGKGVCILKIIDSELSVKSVFVLKWIINSSLSS